jgi:hypothetical protein
MPLVKCDCGETKRILVTEDIAAAVDMLEWLVEHWQKHKIIYSETDLLNTLTVKTPFVEDKE